MTCEEAEIATLQRRHGALDAAASAALDAHRAGCESCRRFDDDSAELERAMQERVVEELKKVDWSKVETRMATVREQARHTLSRSLAMGAMLTVLIAWANGGPGLASYLVQGAYAAAIAGAVAAFLWWAMRRRLAEAVAAQRSPLELLIFYRTQIERALPRTAMMRWLLVAQGVLWIGVGTRMTSPKQVALFVGVGVLMFGVAAVTHRDYRRLVAEKRELA